MSELELDVRLLLSIAASVDDTADSLETMVMAAGSGPQPPAGSAAGEAARSAKRLWMAELRGLHRDLGTFAADLSTSAKEYAASDQASAQGVRAAGNGAPR